jgi:biotin transport system substrate-specific component
MPNMSPTRFAPAAGPDRPNRKETTVERSLTLIALFAALIAALAFVPSVQLVSGVPISAQSLGVMLCGTVLGARRGALAVLLFLALVAAGLPLLSGGRGGLGVFAGPTVGYLVGFPVGAFVIGRLAGRFAQPMGFWPATLAALAGGVVVVNALGILGMWWRLDLTFPQAVVAAAPFMPGDIVKAVLAGAITQGLSRARPGLVALRS